MKCSAMLSAIALTRYMFFHSGSRSKLSFSESEFIALNISTVTRIERLIVVAVCDISFVNMLQPISGKALAHLWKCVCNNNVRDYSTSSTKYTHELVKRDLRASGVEDEPPSVSKHSGDTDIDADNHVAEEQPLAYERLAAVSRRHTHD